MDNEGNKLMMDLKEKVAVLIRDVEELDKDIGKVADMSRQALVEAKNANNEAIIELRTEFKEIKKAFDQITSTISRIQNIALGVAIMYLIQIMGFDAILKKLLGLLL
jgi:prophage DNA circulation protein